jgi:hypothetical protein
MRNYNANEATTQDVFFLTYELAQGEYKVPLGRAAVIPITRSSGLRTHNSWYGELGSATVQN